MSEMIERIARAALALDDTIWVGDNQMLYFMRVAVAAIEEMREPTDIMLKAGASKLDDDLCTETNALNVWQAMIDEALK